MSSPSPPRSGGEGRGEVVPGFKGTQFLWLQFYLIRYSARDSGWKSDAEQLLKKGFEFVVVHLKSEDYPDCRSLAVSLTFLVDIPREW